MTSSVIGSSPGVAGWTTRRRGPSVVGPWATLPLVRCPGGVAVDGARSRTRPSGERIVAREEIGRGRRITPSRRGEPLHPVPGGEAFGSGSDDDVEIARSPVQRRCLEQQRASECEREPIGADERGRDVTCQMSTTASVTVSDEHAVRQAERLGIETSTCATIGCSVVGRRVHRRRPGDVRGPTLETTLETGWSRRVQAWLASPAGRRAEVSRVRRHGLRPTVGPRSTDVRRSRASPSSVDA